MHHYRYGKFKLRNFPASWIAIIILSFFALVSAIFDLSMLFIIFPIVLAIILIGTILLPYRERFVLQENAIIVFKGKHKETHSLPSEMTLIISCADISPLFSVRTAVREQTHILKGQYAVTILQKMPLQYALDTLHKNHIKRYTTSTIQTAFHDYELIYSFVCDQAMLNQLIADKEGILIIPESLQTMMEIPFTDLQVYVDRGY